MSNVLNILILDDNRSKHTLIEVNLSRILSVHGYNCAYQGCETVEEALAAMKETSFDVLCLDHQLHAGETGFDLLSLWEENLPEVRPQGHVILHSGNAFKAVQMKSWVDRFKEIHPNALLTTCATQLTFSHHYEFWFENVAAPFLEGKGTSCHPLQAK